MHQLLGDATDVQARASQSPARSTRRGGDKVKDGNPSPELAGLSSARESSTPTSNDDDVVIVFTVISPLQLSQTRKEGSRRTQARYSWYQEIIALG